MLYSARLELVSDNILYSSYQAPQAAGYDTIGQFNLNVCAPSPACHVRPPS